MALPLKSNKENNLNKIIEGRRESANLREIPHVLIPVWQIKIRERFGINVDREIAGYIAIQIGRHSNVGSKCRISWILFQ